MRTVVPGLLVPLIGTAAGSGAVFFLRRDLKPGLAKLLNGFASGVMAAASVWSLLLPAIEQSSAKGKWAFLPAFTGFWTGILFLLLTERVSPRLQHRAKLRFSQTATMVFAVTLHNIPEGMAVGVACAGLLCGSDGVTAEGVLALSLGIAIQNFPEGAIVSMPLFAEGKSKPKAFWLGVLSGAVEPLFGALTVAAAGAVVPAMPYLLSFAAGAMLYVVVEELIPELAAEGRGGLGAAAFAAGFSLMMALDVAAG